jgi:hypothetical protein
MSRILIFLTLLGTVKVASATSAIIPSISKHASMIIDKTTYTETVDCGSVAQPDIFRRARMYLLQSAPDDKLLLNDKETGDLISNASLSITIPRTEGSAGGVYLVRYVLTIECANRKYRSGISGIEVLQVGNIKSIPLDAFKLQSEKDLKFFQTELESKLKGRLEELKTNVKDFKSF